MGTPLNAAGRLPGGLRADHEYGDVLAEALDVLKRDRRWRGITTRGERQAARAAVGVRFRRRGQVRRPKHRSGAELARAVDACVAWYWQRCPDEFRRHLRPPELRTHDPDGRARPRQRWAVFSFRSDSDEWIDDVPLSRFVVFALLVEVSRLSDRGRRFVLGCAIDGSATAIARLCGWRRRTVYYALRDWRRAGWQASTQPGAQRQGFPFLRVVDYEDRHGRRRRGRVHHAVRVLRAPDAERLPPMPRRPTGAARGRQVVRQAFEAAACQAIAAVLASWAAWRPAACSEAPTSTRRGAAPHPQIDPQGSCTHTAGGSVLRPFLRPCGAAPRRVDVGASEHAAGRQEPAHAVQPGAVEELTGPSPRPPQTSNTAPVFGNQWGAPLPRAGGVLHSARTFGHGAAADAAPPLHVPHRQLPPCPCPDCDQARRHHPLRSAFRGVAWWSCANCLPAPD